MARILEINPRHPQPRKVAQVVKALEDGAVVAYPTDTSYGLGCDVLNLKALRRLHEIKRRPTTALFSFICPDLKEISHYATVSNYAYKTLRRLLPGPYTFILPASRQVPKIMLSRRKTVGIRIPDHPVPVAIARALGRPLVNATATDPEGNLLLTPQEINQALGGAVEIIVDGGPVPGVSSSVVSLVADTPEVLREGAGDVGEFL